MQFQLFIFRKAPCLQRNFHGRLLSIQVFSAVGQYGLIVETLRFEDGVFSWDVTAYKGLRRERRSLRGNFGVEKINKTRTFFNALVENDVLQVAAGRTSCTFLRGNHQ